MWFLEINMQMEEQGKTSSSSSNFPLLEQERGIQDIDGKESNIVTQYVGNQKLWKTKLESSTTSYI